jgi:hypothetical protein
MMKSRQRILSFLLPSILLAACDGGSSSGGGDTVAALVFNPSPGTYTSAITRGTTTTTWIATSCECP